MKVKVEGIYTKIDEPHASVSLKLTPSEQDAIRNNIESCKAVGEQVAIALNNYRRSEQVAIALNNYRRSEEVRAEMQLERDFPIMPA